MRLLWFILCVFFSLDLQAQPRLVSPRQFGYDEAKTGEERYTILYRTHCEAVKTGADVDYSGLNEIELTIPSNAKSIPLTNNNDFKGVKFIVTNNSKDFFLFQRLYPIEPIMVTKRMINRGVYSSIKRKTHERALLIIKDITPWVETRNGYSYPAIRYEAIIVENGKAISSPIYPYNSKQSNPAAYYRELDGSGTRVSNLIFIRSTESTHRTCLLKILNEDNIIIENVETNTPESLLTEDAIFSIGNSTNITFKDVHINNTYSGYNSYGYGINLENVSNVQFDNFSGYGRWGVFGNNNVNKVIFKNCRMNRFDIHCYGRDVMFENCEFFDLYNQFSSFFGKLEFKSCVFTNFIPVVLETSYNAYTGFDIYFDHCIFSTNSKSPFIVSIGRIDEDGGNREELSRLCWPNIFINDMTINAENAEKPLYILACGGDIQKRNIDYLKNVKIDNLVYNTSNPDGSLKEVSLCNKNVVSSKIININLKGVKFGRERDVLMDDSVKGKFYITIKQKNGKRHNVKVDDSVWKDVN